MKSYLLKIRGGVEVDSLGKKAGKGPLIAEEISNTLGTSQDQYLFQPVDKFVLDDQGGSVIRWRWDGKSPCLRAQMDGHPPVVIMPMAFDGYNQSVTGDVATTLRAGMSNCSAGLGGTWKPVVAYGISSYESNAMKSSNPHAGIYETNTARTIDVNGGNPACNQGGVVIVYSVDEKMGQTYIHEDKADTLAARDFLALAVKSHPQDSRVKISEDNVNQPLSANMEHDASNGGLVLVLETFHCTTQEDKTAPLKARDYKDPLVIAMDRAAFNQGENAKYDFSITGGGTAQTLVARGPGAVCYRKPVRK